MKLTAKIDGGCCDVWAYGSAPLNDYLFRKHASFGIWPWTNIERKIEQIRERWVEEHDALARTTAERASENK